MRQDPLSLDDSAPAARPLDVSETFAPGAQRAIENAQDLARACGSKDVETVHLLLGTLQLKPPNPQLSALLQLSSLKAEEVRLYAQAALQHQTPLALDAPFKLGDNLRATMRLAGREARRSDSARVDVAHIFIACFRAQNDAQLAAVLAPLKIDADQLSAHLRGLTRGQTARAVQDQSPLAHLTAHGERALDAAHATMRANFCGRISTLHLLIGVLENSDSDAVAALQTLMIDVAQLKQRAAVAAVSDGEIAGPTRRFTPAAKRALDRAKAAARDGGRSHIGSGDLLLGLLPQPALLIERAQFGARPDDPAAAILREIDADLVRAIFNPQGAATPPVKPATVVVPPKKKSFAGVFWFFFATQLVLGVALKNLSWSQGQSRVLAAALLFIIVASGIAAALTRIFPQAAPFKTPSILAFAGALLGAMTALLISQ